MEGRIRSVQIRRRPAGRRTAAPTLFYEKAIRRTTNASVADEIWPGNKPRATIFVKLFCGTIISDNRRCGLRTVLATMKATSSIPAHDDIRNRSDRPAATYGLRYAPAGRLFEDDSFRLTVDEAYAVQMQTAS